MKKVRLFFCFIVFFIFTSCGYEPIYSKNANTNKELLSISVQNIKNRPGQILRNTLLNKLNPEIKSKVKFRAKEFGLKDYENFFLEMFGKNSIDKASLKNTFDKTMLNSKLLIITYPETIFSQAMYSNVPTILIVKKNHYLFSKTA